MVSIDEKAGQIEAVVSDNGIGFDYEKEHAQLGHYGLLGIKERVRLAGGKLDINSQPGLGTKISISIPMGEKVNA